MSAGGGPLELLAAADWPKDVGRGLGTFAGFSSSRPSS
jgi:hypothetical protein